MTLFLSKTESIQCSNEQGSMSHLCIDQIILFGVCFLRQKCLNFLTLLIGIKLKIIFGGIFIVAINFVFVEILLN